MPYNIDKSKYALDIETGERYRSPDAILSVVYSCLNSKKLLLLMVT